MELCSTFLNVCDAYDIILSKSLPDFGILDKGALSHRSGGNFMPKKVMIMFWGKL